jgi:hypothetical protein
VPGCVCLGDSQKERMNEDEGWPERVVPCGAAGDYNRCLERRTPPKRWGGGRRNRNPTRVVLSVELPEMGRSEINVEGRWRVEGGPCSGEGWRVEQVMAGRSNLHRRDLEARQEHEEEK